MTDKENNFVCCLFDALRHGQNIFSHFASVVYPGLSNRDEVSCSRTQHRAPGEILKMNCLSHEFPGQVSGRDIEGGSNVTVRSHIYYTF